MTTEMWVKVLTFSSALVGIVATFVATVPSIQDTQKILIAAGATAIIAVIDASLYIFFQVKKPISNAFKAGVDSMRATK